jgi:WD40 repeat protein
MNDLVAEHPTPAQLRAFGEGKLEPGAFAALEKHISACESCCRALECVPPDSFVGRLKVAERAAFATTCDGPAATVVEVAGVPAELADHPRYRVLGLVGQGGMGAVYKAEHRRMGRSVALKVINPGLMSNPATVQRFHQEARLTAQLHHPNIVTAFDADEAGGLHFLVMEFVEGRSLADLLAERGPLPLSEACDYIRQVARGLQHLHEAGLVHRDVKPHNLMRAGDGTIKVLDCGLARIAGAPDAEGRVAGSATGAGLTGDGTVMGTPDYVAPEQVADARAADIRADIYALGCTFYHLLTGQPPFPEGTSADKFKQHAETPLALPKAWPVALRAVVAKMTAKKPEDRYATPAEVVEALAAVSTVRAGSGSDGKKPRRRWLVAAAVFSLAALILAAIYLRIQTDKGDVVIQTDDPALEIVTKKGGEIVRIRDPKSGQTWELDTKNLTMRDLEHPDGLALEVPWRGQVTLKSAGGKVVVAAGPPAVPAKEEKKPTRVTDPAELAKLPNAADTLKQSDISEIARAYIGGGDLSEVPPELVAVLGDTRFLCSERPGPMAFSADGKLLAVANDRNEIRFLDAQTGRLLRQFTSPYTPHGRMAFSPDGRRLAGTPGNGPFNVIDAETGRLIWKLTDAKVPNVDFFAFSSDSKTVAVCCQDSTSKYPPTVEIRDAATGKLVDSVDVRDRGVGDIAFSPDHTTMVYTWRDNGDVIHVNQTKKETLRLGKQAARVAFGPDGKHFAVSWMGDKEAARVVKIYNAEGKVVHALAAQGGAILAFSKDGKTLVAVHPDGTESRVTRWDVVEGKRLSSATISGQFFGDDDLVSPDGKTLARRRNESCLVDYFDTETGKLLQPIRDPQAMISALAFSPDGKCLASQDWFNTRIWDLATSRELASWREDAYHRLVFSPDSKLLAAAGQDGIGIHSMPDGRMLRFLSSRGDRIESIAFNPDGTLVAGAGGDRVRIWRVSDGKELRLLSYPRHSCCAIFSPDGSKVFAAGKAGIMVWETNTGLEAEHYLKETEFFQTEWLPDGKTLAAHTYGGVWHVDPDNGKVVRKIQISGGDLDYVLSPGARFLAASNRGGFDVTQLGSDPERRRHFRLSPSPELSVDRAGLISSPDGRPGSMAFSRDGRYFAAGNLEGVISVLRLSEKGKVPDLQVLLPTPRELAERPNAADALKHEDVPELARARIGGGDAKKAPKELVALFGDLRFRLPGTAAAPSFSPDGKRILVPCKDHIHILDATTGLITQSIPAPYWDNKPAAAILAPDNRTMAVGSYKELELWNLETGKRLHHLKLKDDDDGMWMSRLAFSPDGKLLTAGCWLSTQVRVWDVATGQPRLWWTWRPKERPHGGINQVAFSADSRMLVALDGDHQLLCWDVPAKGDLKAINAPPGYPAVCKEIVFSADGRVVAFKKADRDEVVVLDAQDPRGEQLGSWPGATPNALTFTRDSKALLAFQAEPQRKPIVRRWDVGTRKFLADVELPAFGQNNLCAFSPDGRTLAVIPNEHDAVVRLVDTATGKYLHPDPGPTQGVYPLIFSPDGNYLAALDRQRGYLWKLSTRELVRTWNVAGYETFAFHPDGKTLAFAGEAGVVLESADGRKRHTLEGPKQKMEKLAFSPDGKLLAAGGGSTNVWVWDTDTGKLVHVLEQREFTEALAFSRDGRVLYSSAGKESWVTAWDLSTGKQLFNGRGDFLAQVLAPLADGKTMAVLDFDAGYRLMDGKTGDNWKPVYLPDELHCDEMPGAIAPGGELVAVSTSTGSLVLWRPDDNEKRYRLFPLGSGKGTRLSAVTFSPDGRYVAVGQHDGTIAVLRLSEKGQLPELRVMAPTASELAERPNAADVLKHDGGDVPEIARAYVGGGDAKKAPQELVGVLGTAAYRCLPTAVGLPAFSPDGKLLAVPTTEQVLLFNAADGRLLRSVAGKPTPVSVVVFSPDGRTLATHAEGGGIEMWDVDSGKFQFAVAFKDDRMKDIQALAFSGDGKSIAAGSATTGLVLAWDTKTGKETFRAEAHPPNDGNGVKDLRFRPNAPVLVTVGNDDRIFLWDTRTGKCSEDFRPRGWCAAWSPDGTTLAVGDSKKSEVRTYTPQGKLQQTFATGDGDRLVFSADGKVLVMICEKGKVRRWDAETGKVLSEAPLWGVSPPSQPVLSPDGRSVALADGGTCEVRVLDTTTGKERLPAAGHRATVAAMAWSPDGKMLLTADVQGRLILWDVARRKEAVAVERPGRSIRQLAFSADGRWVVSVEKGTKDNDPQVALWKAADLTWAGGLSLRKRQEVSQIAISPDGNTIATANADETVSLWDRGRATERHVLPNVDPVSALAFSPSGEELIAGTSGVCKLTMWRVKDGKEMARWERSTDLGAVHHVEWLPNGTEIGELCVAFDRDIFRRQYRIQDLNGEKVQIVANGPEHAKENVALFLSASPSCRLSAYTDSTRKLVVWQPSPNRDLRRYYDGHLSPTAAAFSPDGRYLAVGDQTGLVSILRLAPRGQVPQLPVKEEEPPPPRGDK